MPLRDQLRVMVVDDMSTSRGLILQALDGMGICNVAATSDGRAALAAIDRAPVHLVISDYNMPVMDGLRLLYALRQGGRTARIGFLLVTGCIDPEVYEQGRQLRMDGFLRKPFSVAELKTAIEAIVGRL